MSENIHYSRNSFSIYEVTNKTGIELTLSELKNWVSYTNYPASINNFINILHNATNTDKNKK